MDAKGATVKFYFCNKCRKRIIPPKFLLTAKIQGNINLKCGDEKCSGQITIKNKKQDEQVHNKSE